MAHCVLLLLENQGCDTVFLQVSALQAEHERSVFYPKPAPPGSEMHQKLLAAAAGAIMHGQFSCAQECLEAAGEWETAMALAVCAGDFASLRNLAVGLQVSYLRLHVNVIIWDSFAVAVVLCDSSSNSRLLVLIGEDRLGLRSCELY